MNEEADQRNNSAEEDPEDYPFPLTLRPKGSNANAEPPVAPLNGN
jgi:hypothetical protein